MRLQKGNWNEKPEDGNFTSGFSGKNMNEYRCVFVFRGEEFSSYSKRGLDAFYDGFWINDKLETSVGEDVRYWIPPHKIEYIEKVPEEG